MSCVIPFPTRSQAAEPSPVRRPSSTRTDVAGLAARLQRIERCSGADEAKVDQLVDAELAVLDALAQAPARDQAEVALKLAALLRRSEAEDDGFLPEGEMALLRSALRDLRRLGRQKVLAQA
ncbi:hypothetical protein QWZ14_08025 [Paeniroseomonas aquatica]|uniref:Uncharacterized protein n=1 Tax=Paeniroseomonas aquatica TaxID=373043 RepID=A0ABT8A438_9PROT|nr:hypothetical protein [Paeniroseomonas aquatica]MDN3564313.1 hypothetical protein [Paeniroseomonas aquatica]